MEICAYFLCFSICVVGEVFRDRTLRNAQKDTKNINWTSHDKEPRPLFLL